MSVIALKKLGWKLLENRKINDAKLSQKNQWIEWWFPLFFEKSIDIDLSFIDESKKGIIISDGIKGFIQNTVLPANKYEIKFKAYGGFVMKFE